MLSNRSALELHHTEDRAVAPHLSAPKACIERLYSLIKPGAILIKDTQRTQVPAEAMTLHDLMAIRVSLL